MTLEHRLQQAYGHPDDETRTRLDARMEAIVAAPEPPRRARASRRLPGFGSLTRGPIVAVAMSAVIAVVVVAGGVQSGSDRAPSGSDTSLVAQDKAGSAAGGSAESSAGAPVPSIAPQPPQAGRSTSDEALVEPTEPSIAPVPVPSTPTTKPGGKRDTIESTSMRLLTDDKTDFANATERIPAIATGLGGHVQSAQVSRDGASGQASYQLVVPKPALPKALNQLAAVAEVQTQSSQLTDVTDQTTQAAVSVKTLTKRVSSLRAQVASATDATRPGLSAQLEAARAQLADARQQRDALGQSVASTTISVTIDLTDESVALESDEPEADEAWSPATAWDAVGQAWTWMGGVLVVVGLVGAPIWLLLAIGWLRRRRT